MMTPRRFVMDPDVYDAIDLVSEMEGGLLRSRAYVRDGRCGCMIGAAHFAGVYGEVAPNDVGRLDAAHKASERFSHLTPSWGTFDRAHMLLERFDASKRLPWKLLAETMNVVRGEVAS